MAVYSKQGLIAELLDRTELVKAGTQPFLRLTDEQLTFKPGPDTWSIVQIFGHLNISHAICIRNILSRMTKAPEVEGLEFHSGWLGDLIYEKMMPRQDGSVFRIKSPRTLHAGEGYEDVREVLQEFLHQCDALDDILRHALTKDMERIRIPFSVVRLIKLRLGDHLRYLVAHSERHLLQAHRVMGLLPAENYGGAI